MVDTSARPLSKSARQWKLRVSAESGAGRGECKK